MSPISLITASPCSMRRRSRLAAIASIWATSDARRGCSGSEEDGAKNRLVLMGANGMMDVSVTPMFIKASSALVKAGASAVGSPRALRSSTGSERALPAASPIMMRLRAFAGVAGGDGEEGISTIGDDEEAAAMACVARAIVNTADNLYVGVGSHTPLSGRMARLGPSADQGVDRS